MNDWKPGTLAMITGVDGSVLAFRQERQWATLNQLYFNDWQLSDIRPLVVIDPEDREAVERFTKVFWSERQGVGLESWTPPAEVEAMTAALREFAAPKPPRPDEPQALAARVIDDQGDEWARIRRGNKSFWVNGFGGNAYSWDALVDDFGPLEVRP